MFESLLKHKCISVPKSSRLFVVGDIHGKYYLLEKFFDRVNFDMDNDYLIATGDIIDRGNQNIKLLDLFLNNDNFNTCIGNHEFMMLNPHWSRTWLDHGGDKTLSEMNLVDYHEYSLKILKNMPVILTFEYNNKMFGTIHASTIFNNQYLVQRDDVIQYINEEYIWDTSLLKAILSGFNTNPIEGIDMMFHGHYGVKNRLIEGNRMYIDTYYEMKDLTFIEIVVDDNEINYNIV